MRTTLYPSRVSSESTVRQSHPPPHAPWTITNVGFGAAGAWTSNAAARSSAVNLELEILQVLEVHARRGQLARPVLRALFLHVRRLLLERRDRGEEALEVEHPRAQRRVARAVGLRVLDVEAPEPVGILLHVLERITPAEQHVADI